MGLYYFIMSILTQYQTKPISLTMDEYIQERGGYIAYTKDTKAFKNMSLKDQVGYALYLLQFNIFRGQNVMRGLENMRKIETVTGIFKVDTPENTLARVKMLIVYIVTTIFFLFCILAIVFLIIMGVMIAMKKDITQMLLKQTIVNLTIGYMFMSIALVFLINKISDKTTERLNDIQVSLQQ